MVVIVVAVVDDTKKNLASLKSNHLQFCHNLIHSAFEGALTFVSEPKLGHFITLG